MPYRFIDRSDTLRFLFEDAEIRNHGGVNLESDGGYPVWGILDEDATRLVKVVIDLDPGETDAPAHGDEFRRR